MRPELTSATRLIALLGDPVGHSLSPIMQNGAFAAAGLDAVYLAIRCGRSDVAGLLVGIARAGGAGNITLPHKDIAAAVVERATDAVVRTGACNTYWLEEGVVCGDNTDVVGVSAAVRVLLGRPTHGARVLLLGAGGAARGAAYALTRDGADQVVILNRSRDRADDLRARFDGGPTTFTVARDAESLSGESFDLVVNATSLGLRPDDPLPLSPECDLYVAAALDLVYASGTTTAWIRAQQEQGIRATDGLEMLIQQGIASFRRWWGMDPPVEAMRGAVMVKSEV